MAKTYSNGRGAEPHTIRESSDASPEPIQGVTPLRTARLKAGLVQREVCERADVTKGYLSKLERGEHTNPTLGMARRLARALDTTVNDIFPPGGESNG